MLSRFSRLMAEYGGMLFLITPTHMTSHQQSAMYKTGQTGHFARHPFSFEPENIGRPVNRFDNCAVNHVVAAGLLNVESYGFGEED